MTTTSKSGIRLSTAEGEALGLLSRSQLAGGPDRAWDAQQRREWLVGQVEHWRDLLNSGEPMGLELWLAVRGYLVSEAGEFWPRPATLRRHWPALPDVAQLLLEDVTLRGGDAGALQGRQLTLEVALAVAEHGGQPSGHVVASLWWQSRGRTVAEAVARVPAVLDTWGAAQERRPRERALREELPRWRAEDRARTRELLGGSLQAGAAHAAGHREREAGLVSSVLGGERARGAA